MSSQLVRTASLTPTEYVYDKCTLESNLMDKIMNLAINIVLNMSTTRYVSNYSHQYEASG